MVALRDTGSNAKPEAKAEKRRANPLTNTLPTWGWRNSYASNALPLCQQGRKGRCVHFAPSKLGVGHGDECRKSVAPWTSEEGTIRERGGH